MTVLDLLALLQNLADRGHGNDEVWYRDGAKVITPISETSVGTNGVYLLGK